ncbi:multidrug resistance protein fnx1 [Trichosporon asahii var. asahii CBS 2479]|uniref:Multidrug resistance protein fnx1 n=1 Tax=Trichosporon asahii var. asahii (strain ATCC 90039 / CBS 2479 / JCM 2466 / KCTC 7840 / NBRC 103889/ NCYC 2677 / UAMH 7654) TaxID=1186058 RepID=J6F865_TRIAS|nr:multidrug resistance protein fnx1 [Trichosporon asahii var. asahii CBS 2479]EJT51517.1 multidrug resistance protein fnx1 [Trichosporon asahii var. asahii CBS 2479]
MPGAGEHTPLLVASEPTPTTRRLVVATSLLAGFLGVLDLTIVATCIPTISSELHSFDRSSWIGTAYLWSNVTFTPLYGRLADILGRRRAFRQALLLFTVGTLGCGVAPSFALLCLGRFVAGMGGGGMSTVSSVVVAETFPPALRGFYQGLNMMVFGLGIGLGGPIGGWLTETFGWRAAFFAQIPIALTLYVLVGYSVPGKARGQTRWGDIDFGGSLTLLLSIGCLLRSLGSENSAVPFALASAGFFAVFILVELCFARVPVLPLTLLKRRVPLCIGIISGVIAIVNFNMLYHLPMVFEIVLGQSLSSAGSHLLPNSIAMAIFSPLAGLYVNRARRYKWAIVLSACGPLLSMILLTFLGPHSSEFVQWTAVIPMGTGFGALLTLTLVANLEAVSRDEIATATGFVFIWRCIGQVLGVGISDAVFQTSLGHELALRFKDGTLIDRLRKASSVIKKLPLSQRLLAREAYGAALRNTFIFGSIGAAIVLVTSFFIPDEPLHEQEKPVSTEPRA